MSSISTNNDQILNNVYIKKAPCEVAGSVFNMVLTLNFQLDVLVFSVSDSWLWRGIQPRNGAEHLGLRIQRLTVAQLYFQIGQSGFCSLQAGKSILALIPFESVSGDSPAFRRKFLKPNLGIFEVSW